MLDMMRLFAQLTQVRHSDSITSVQGGVVSNAGYDEIVCSTYAGKTHHYSVFIDI